MRSILRLVFLLCGTYVHLSAQQTPQLSPQAQISILTVGPGKELYSQFGHSALAIEDPQLGISVAYNYGVFDFRTEGFYLKFLRGQLPYQLGRSPLYPSLQGWYEEGRWVKKQYLKLSPAENQAILQFLETNYLPENREYAYKFFFDNCSSRLADVIQHIKKDSIQWDTTWNAHLTFRDWIDIYSKQQENHWSDFGMDLALGTPADQLASWKQALFLPDNLASALDRAKVFSNGQWVPLVQSEEYQAGADVGPPIPAMIRESWLLPLLVIVYFFWFSRSNFGWTVEWIITSVFGLASLVLILLWFGTDHGVTGPNAHLIWTFPHLLWIKPLAKVKSKKYIWLIYWLICGVLFLFCQQAFHPMFSWLVLLQMLLTFKPWKNSSWI